MPVKRNIQGDAAMARMRAVDAAVAVLEKEGIVQAFGVPGAAINPLYSAMKKRGSIKHVLARHVEGASHMAEGYTRTKPGNIGVCLGTSGPAGAARVPAGLPHHAFGPSGSGAERSAVRRAGGRDRVRHRHLRAAAGV